MQRMPYRDPTCFTPTKRCPHQGMEPEGGERMSHTPGPWRVNESKISGKDNISDLTEIVGPQRNGSQRLIAKMYGCALPEGQANARLIAAAPELLEVFKAALWNVERVTKGRPVEPSLARWLEKARAVLAKVRGDEARGDEGEGC